LQVEDCPRACRSRGPEPFWEMWMLESGETKIQITTDNTSTPRNTPRQLTRAHMHKLHTKPASRTTCTSATHPNIVGLQAPTSAEPLIPHDVVIHQGSQLSVCQEQMPIPAHTSIRIDKPGNCIARPFAQRPYLWLRIIYGRQQTSNHRCFRKGPQNGAVDLRMRASGMPRGRAGTCAGEPNAGARGLP
jgi:hypothetical protein